MTLFALEFTVIFCNMLNIFMSYLLKLIDFKERKAKGEKKYENCFGYFFI